MPKIYNDMNDILGTVYLNGNSSMVYVPEGVLGNCHEKAYLIREEEFPRYRRVLVRDLTSRKGGNPVVLEINHRGPKVSRVRYHKISNPKRGMSETEKLQLEILTRAVAHSKLGISLEQVNAILDGGIRNLI